MNRKQLIVMWVGIAIGALMWLFPPVEVTMVGLSGNYFDAGCIFIVPPHVAARAFEQAKSRGYLDEVSTSTGPIWYPVGGASNRAAARLDMQQLLAQWITVAVITGGLIVTLRKRRAGRPPDPACVPK